MLETFPASIVDPNPPFRFGHRNASDAPPNSAPNTSIEATKERRKNSRRVTAGGGFFGFSSFGGFGGFGSVGGASPVSAIAAAASARRIRMNVAAMMVMNRTNTMMATNTATFVGERASKNVIVRRTTPAATATPS